MHFWSQAAAAMRSLSAVAGVRAEEAVSSFQGEKFAQVAGAEL